MEKLYKTLGKVNYAKLYIEDHGILTLNIDIDFGSSGQGFGGYSLDSYNKKIERREGTASGMDFVIEVLKLFNVSSLDEIKGKPVYALKEKKDGWDLPIVGLQTPEFDGGRRFLPEEWQKKWEHEG